MALISGVSGQDGSYLAHLLIRQDYKVIGLTRELSDESILHHRYLGIDDKVQLVQADISNYTDCRQLIEQYQPDEVYNLAAQSSVSESFKRPLETINFNVTSVANLLEAIRQQEKKIRFYQASSSEMFGKVDKLPIRNDTQLHPISPYGISKATGHWMVSQYREAYNLFAVSGILFNHESFLRPETFFVKKVITSAIRIMQGAQDILSVGNIDIKRDFGLASEYVKAIWMIMQLEKPQDFQVCSGTSVSLRSIVYYVFDKLGVDRDRVVHDPKLYRPVEILDIYGDRSELEEKTAWRYTLTFFEALDILIEEELTNMAKGRNQ